ncbi:outer membrane protein assembly factor BamB family protein [Dyadobacter fanqingshengii]|uniref:PQQ-binding-like beta-propeller repeat protein n=1 Tax=Dyadobacter fanqingshengii TaxID=2906443 RepID=A0A9X1PD94_9BACT|nr:PQQ-binding-like beta-propeller repeat protein [Dyadobacter fanqingshengii]MCF0042029.1 PQQ-binding-like beta-propeller repeat protein [Dyadobacter fanqingshengii]USJ36268.1 PQQ-binding-like beta-propeller repeat protein [Dyadobacter fanqingshengii]
MKSERTGSLSRFLQQGLLMAGLLLAECKTSEPAGSEILDSAYGPGWSAVHADSRNSDYSSLQGPRKVELAWQRKFEGTINLGPTIGRQGQVYMTTNAGDCHLYALDPQTGKTVWCTDKVNKFAVASSALLDEQGRLFIADNEAMHAFDALGNLLWETEIQGFPLSAQFTQTGRLIFTTHIGMIYVLDRKNGSLVLNPHPLSGEPPSDPNFDPRACMRGTADCPCANTLAIDQQTGRFFFTYWAPGAVQAGVRAMVYSEKNGPSIKPLWEHTALPGGSASSPDISADGSRIYVNDNAGGLHAIEAATGNSIWEFAMGYEPGGSQSTSPEGLIMPAGGGGAPLMCIQDMGQEAKLVWKNDSLNHLGLPMQTAGNLAFATVAGSPNKSYKDLVIVNTKTGEVLDRVHFPGKTLFTVGTTIGGEGNVYVPGFDGTLFAFRPK